MTRINSNYDEKPAVHSFQKVEGFVSCEIRNTIFEDPVVVGDTVDVFVLPDGRHLLSKDPDGIRIREINSVYVLFDTEILIKEE
jgi:hypothetical protein